MILKKNLKIILQKIHNYFKLINCIFIIMNDIKIINNYLDKQFVIFLVDIKENDDKYFKIINKQCKHYKYCKCFLMWLFEFNEIPFNIIKKLIYNINNIN